MCLMAVWGSLCPFSGASAAEGKLERLAIPEALPNDATYYDAADEANAVATHRGKIVVLHFWATWCAPCVVELPEMRKALSGFDTKDLLLLPVSLDFKAEAVRKFYADKGLDYPVVMDKKSALLRSLAIKGLPGTVILNRKGEIIARHSGLVDWASPRTADFLKAALKD